MNLEETSGVGRSGEVQARIAPGAVRGRWEGGLAVFRGVPFARPPVGEDRFAAPRPVPAWDGAREAFAFGPPPPQDVGIPGRSGVLEASAGDGWLTVNVWSPEPDPAARRPVMVWIYGGAYKLGFSGSPGYDAHQIAADGDVVVVSFNYRVGIEGFAHIAGAPANRGLLDQVAALEWVRDNIAAFGGDPERVTVFGESAGAGSIAALLAMPRAAGLFRRAILQSPAGIFFSDALAADIAAAIAAAAGQRATVEDLSLVDPYQLVDAGAVVTTKMREHADRWGPVAHTISPFAPVVDGDVLPVAPWEALAAGSARDVELIIGHNRDECRLFTVLAGQHGHVGQDDAAVALRAFGPGPDGERAYRAAFPDASAGQLHELVQTDWLFRMPTLHLADAQNAGGGRAHLYELTWPAPGGDGVLGACHGLDGPLVFGTFAAHLGPLLLGPEPPAEARTLAARIRGAWTDFASTGDPGWPAYDPERRLTQVFDAPPTVTPYPEEKSRALWRDHVFSALPLLVP
ncbi:carboxylesterase family protein [Frankia sp. CNm7]|uniref:Carboxylic ester hydrolase n=1 Tax=Frankia nepalensis TaxID=1836974 RepID=A0A937RBY6_9ACTN|nr:carboxylesterase family protein [Frankia nepalensis]MBL7500858.1 carboxylesterase family protein [Frankia nepalensis]MBL7509224.1 carboxylesterase family protein [Frankia nepalensis]MBL7517316.1 carboxylesterase family protein [Frankia nepalensis]MBL7627012.1 carboxylesterase family protein [Frankia nepalensis]